MKKSRFNLSHEVLLTADFGTLIPILVQECLPGDKFRISTEMFTRFQALIAPAMQRVDAKIEYFFVPNRIIFHEWKNYITNKDQTGDTLPRLSSGNIPSTLKGKNSLVDYMGLPCDCKTMLDDGTWQDMPANWANVNALPFIAYQRIWYDWYSDQNLQESTRLSLEDTRGEFNTYLSGSIEPNIYCRLRNRCYPRDYFTSALPWAQAGEAARVPIHLPDGTGAQANGFQLHSYPLSSADPLKLDGGWVKAGSTVPKFTIADSSKFTGPTIEEMRRTNAIQRWLEKNARYGRRYIEQIAAHFGVRVPDYRLDRSEYLGSNKAPISISEVLQQSQTTEESPLGDFAGHAVGAGISSMRPYRCYEHGYIIGILSFIPRASYGEGVPRPFIKDSYLDFAFPEFDRLGEQPIQYRELDGYTSGSAQNTFGYVPRYWEYKRAFNRFCGEFRDNLAYWHLGRIWGQLNQPALNADFITIDGGQSGRQNERIFAVQDGETPHILVQLYHHISAVRPLSNKPPKL